MSVVKIKWLIAIQKLKGNVTEFYLWLCENWLSWWELLVGNLNEGRFPVLPRVGELR